MLYFNADIITMQTMVYWKVNQCSIVMPTSSQCRRWRIGRRTIALLQCRHHHSVDNGVLEGESMLYCNATSSQCRRWCIGKRINDQL